MNVDRGFEEKLFARDAHFNVTSQVGWTLPAALEVNISAMPVQCKQWLETLETGHGITSPYRGSVCQEHVVVDGCRQALDQILTHRSFRRRHNHVRCLRGCAHVGRKC